MTSTTLQRPAATTTVPSAAASSETSGAQVDNRASYAAFAGAYLLGHGAAALSSGPSPVLDLPGWLPTALLVAGLAAGAAASISASTRAQRHLQGPELLFSKLVGIAWVTGFTALALIITGLQLALDAPEVQTLLWPTGSGLVVGLIYIAEGALRRNAPHYLLGSWLALTCSAALLLPAAGLYWVLALAGGGGYLLALAAEQRRSTTNR